MSGDGVSLQTNLVQLSNVATSTARSGQGAHAATPANEPADRRETARLKRVNEAEKSERQHVDPDQRREREDAKSRGDDPDQAAPPEAPTSAPGETGSGAPIPGLGGIFDRKA